MLTHKEASAVRHASHCCSGHWSMLPAVLPWSNARHALCQEWPFCIIAVAIIIIAMLVLLFFSVVSNVAPMNMLLHVPCSDVQWLLLT